MDERNPNKRLQFGRRHLESDVNVFDHNAWDNVQWDEEQLAAASEKIQENSSELMDFQQANELETNAHDYWNKFYSTHQDKFFKDRHWLFTEFPELLVNCIQAKEQIPFERSFEQGASNDDSIKTNPVFQTSNDELKIWEIGCGVGNTTMSILNVNRHAKTKVFCSDFSSVAVDILKKRCENEPRCIPFVYDATTINSEEMPFEEESLDVIMMIFTLSAIPPEKINQVLTNAARYLKPQGVFLFRDYGRYDLAQLRFKKGRCLRDNFYARSDGTLAYFFSEDELEQRITEATSLRKCWIHVDRRLMVNRSKQLKMYRIWIQAKFIKP